MTAVLEGLSEREGPNKAHYTEVLAKLKARFFELYKIEDETFTRLVFNMDN